MFVVAGADWTSISVSDQQEMIQQLSNEEKQLRRTGDLLSKGKDSLTGASLAVVASLERVMGLFIEGDDVHMCSKLKRDGLSEMKLRDVMKVDIMKKWKGILKLLLPLLKN